MEMDVGSRCGFDDVAVVVRVASQRTWRRNGFGVAPWRYPRGRVVLRFPDFLSHRMNFSAKQKKRRGRPLGGPLIHLFSRRRLSRSFPSGHPGDPAWTLPAKNGPGRGSEAVLVVMQTPFSKRVEKKWIWNSSATKAARTRGPTMCGQIECAGRFPGVGRGQIKGRRSWGIAFTSLPFSFFASDFPFRFPLIPVAIRHGRRAKIDDPPCVTGWRQLSS